MGKNISHLKIGSETYDLRPYAVCTSSATAEIKSLTIDGFSVYNGAEITILFENGNLYWDDFGLNVNGDDDIFVGINGDNYHGGKIFPPNTTHTFRYDGTRWEMISYNGLYPTINCTYDDLCNFTREDMLIPGQTYKILYDTYLPEDCYVFEDVSRNQSVWFYLILTAKTKNSFYEKVEPVAPIGSRGFDALAINDFEKYQMWYSLTPDLDKASYIWDKLYVVYTTDWDGYQCNYLFNKQKYEIYNGTKYYKLAGVNYWIDNNYSGIFYRDGWSFEESDEIYVDDIDSDWETNKDFCGIVYRIIDDRGNDIPFDYITFSLYNKNDTSSTEPVRWQPIVGTSPKTANNVVKMCEFGTKNENDYRYPRIPNVFIVGSSNTIIDSNHVYVVGSNNTITYSNEIRLWSGSNGNTISYGTNIYLAGTRNHINNSYNCTIGKWTPEKVYSNEIFDSHNITLVSNTNGYDCRFNKINGSYNLSIQNNSCNANTFGLDCSDITLGTSCYGNTFEGGNSSIKLGSSSFHNKFGIETTSINIGSNSEGNTFGSYCSNNNFGTHFKYNTLGNYVRHMSVRTSKSSSGTLRNYVQKCRWDDGADSVVLYNTTQGTGSTTTIMNVHVLQGNTNSTYGYAAVSYNQSYEIQVRKNASQTITVTT